MARLSPAPCPWRDARSPWQLRGMATAPAARGTGVGRALLDGCLSQVVRRAVAAAGCYERTGLTVVTGEYDKPGIGPHVGMLTDLVPLTPR